LIIMSSNPCHTLVTPQLHTTIDQIKESFMEKMPPTKFKGCIPNGDLFTGDTHPPTISDRYYDTSIFCFPHCQYDHRAFYCTLIDAINTYIYNCNTLTCSGMESTLTIKHITTFDTLFNLWTASCPCCDMYATHFHSSVMPYVQFPLHPPIDQPKLNHHIFQRLRPTQPLFCNVDNNDKPHSVVFHDKGVYNIPCYRNHFIWDVSQPYITFAVIKESQCCCEDKRIWAIKISDNVFISMTQEAHPDLVFFESCHESMGKYYTRSDALRDISGGAMDLALDLNNVDMDDSDHIDNVLSCIEKDQHMDQDTASVSKLAFPHYVPVKQVACASITLQHLVGNAFHIPICIVCDHGLHVTLNPQTRRVTISTCNINDVPIDVQFLGMDLLVE